MPDQLKIHRHNQEDGDHHPAFDGARLTDPAGGKPLEPEVRASLEPRFSHDFSQVRVFDDSQADRSAEDLSARAFTVQQNVFFRSGEYAPHTSRGMHLLAHELTHTIQQSTGPVSGTPTAEGVSVSEPGDPFEVAAEQAADAVVAGEPVTGSRLPAGGPGTGRIAKRASQPNGDAPPADPPHGHQTAEGRVFAPSIQLLALSRAITLQRQPTGGTAPALAPPRPDGSGPNQRPAPPAGRGPAPPTGTQTAPRPPGATPPRPAGPAPAGGSPAPAPRAGGTGPSPATGAAPAGPSGTTATTPAGQPTGLPANPGGGISRENASSGIDWAGFFQGTGGNVLRTGLEVSRLIPGWGLLGGIAADSINIYQDMTAVPFEDAPVTEKLVIVRSAVMVINNGVGHITYIAQLAQDGVTISVVFAPLVPVTASANEALKTVKVCLDGAQFMLDFSIGCAASYHASKSPPPKSDKWNSFANNYTANVLGDAVAIIFDAIDLASGGFSNSEAVQLATKAGKSVFTTARFLVPAVRQVLQGWFGVFGGNIPFSGGGGGGGGGGGTAATSAPAAGAGPTVQRNNADAGTVGPALVSAAEAAAFRIISNELRQIKGMYQVGDGAIDLAAGAIKFQIEQMNRMAKQVLGGRDPFTTIRDATKKGLDEMQQHIGQLTEMQFFASSGKEKAAAVHTSTTDAITKLDAIVVPSIQIPKAELGEGALAEAGEAVLNLGGSVANTGLETTLRQLQNAVDEAKKTLRSPLEKVRDHATEIGDFLQVVDQQASLRIGQLTEKVSVFSEKLGRCQNIEDVINLIVAQIMEAAGLQGEIKVEDIRQAWRSLGPEIDAAIAWADRRAAAASQGRAAGPSSGEPGPQLAPAAAAATSPATPSAALPSPPH